MPVPPFHEFLRPLLECFSDGKTHHVRDFYDPVAQMLALTDQDRQSLLPSGRDTVFENRVGWARTYLKKAGLIDVVQRGIHRISERGRRALQDCPQHIEIA